MITPPFRSYSLQHTESPRFSYGENVNYKEVRSFVYEAVCLVSKIHDINYAGLRLNDDTKFHTEIAELIVNTVLTIIKYEDY